MGAPIGNCNACKYKHKTGVNNRSRNPLKLKKIERLEIMYHKKHGSLDTFKIALKTSKPKILEYINRRNRLLKYFKSK